MVAFRRAVDGLASPWLVLFAIALGLALMAYARLMSAQLGWAMAVPFGLMTVSLMAAVFVKERLRKQPGLLIFHLALAVLALLAGAGQMIGLRGRVEITEGASFDPAIAVVKAAPWHVNALGELNFTQGPFAIDYQPGMKRGRIQSRIRVPSEAGVGREWVVGDDVPFIQKGYRFYTTSNKGFALILTFTNAEGKSHTSAVHLPSYPVMDFQQGRSWVPPGMTNEMTIWLHIPKPVYKEDAAWRFAKPEGSILRVMEDATNVDVLIGQTIPLMGGRLRYDDLRTWMGYSIYYDPTLPWLAAAAVVAMGGLAWHLIERLRPVLSLESADRALDRV